MTPVTPSRQHISAADGTRLAITDYVLPAALARGAVCIVHGLGEHSGRYLQLARFFNAAGLSVRCFDHRGHGHSEGPRGDCPHGAMLLDLEMVFDDFANHSATPPFLFGHSMGGLFAVHFTLSRRSPVRGLVLSSPALAVDLNGPQRFALKLLRRLAPGWGAPNGLNPNVLSHDAEVVRAYRQDPLVHPKLSARLLDTILQSIAFCRAQANTLATPTLLAVAGDDHAVNASGSQQFFARTPAGMAEMRWYENFYHEILNEPNSPRVYGDLQAWLDAHLAA